MCDVWCIDCLSFKSASMNPSLMGETRESLCFFLAFKAGYVQFVLDSEYLGQPGEIKDIIHNVFTENLVVGKLKRLVSDRPQDISKTYFPLFFTAFKS